MKKMQNWQENIPMTKDKFWEAHPLTGLMYCADCGGKMYVHRTYNGKRVPQYTCGQYGKYPIGSLCPTQHRIKAEAVLTLIADMLRAIAEYSRNDRAEFIRTVQETQVAQQTADISKKRKRLAAAQKRAGELEKLICKIYEDNALGKLPDARYEALDAQYAKEQDTLNAEIVELEKAVTGYEQSRKSAEKFIALIDKYENFDTLTNTMLNEFVEKILVHERARKGSQDTTQEVEIYFNFVGRYIPPALQPVPLTPEEQEELRKKEERKDRLHQNYLRRKANGKQKTAQVNLTWDAVAAKIADLIEQRLRLLVYNDQYLTDAEKATYQAWAAEQQAARAANDAALAHAKHAITDFCENEGLNEPNFSDLTRVEFAYSTTEDDEHEIQVYANLLRNEIRYEVDGNIVHIDYFQDNHELAAQGIENSAFSDFINTAEAEFEKHHPTTRKVEKSPVTIGNTVYLEDARPFTVEEIGRENIHLRDESFPLVGRAVSHEEFARLLAANPKNAALSAPEVPSRQAQQEETAESIVGEIVEEPSPFVAQVMADAERLSAEDEPYHREPITYEAPYLDNLPTAPREKFAANIAAIQKLKEIEQRVANGGSPAFEDEQKILAQYTGWGGLSDAFDPNKSAWSNEYSQLKAALSESEYEAARSSTLTAFYTPATVIHPIYRALERFGVKGGKILEPSMGTGAFLAHGHFGSSDAKFYGVELDSITGRISKQLYQKANIQVTGYENALLPDNYFDCVMGNVPFGNFQVNDPQYNRLHFPIHDYFFAKSIDKLRTGGIMAFITSSGTLDKKDDRARKYIAERCDLIGAVRLPSVTLPLGSYHIEETQALHDGCDIVGGSIDERGGWLLRPGYRDMMQQIKGGKVDRVYICRMRQISGKERHLYSFFKRLIPKVTTADRKKDPTRRQSGDSLLTRGKNPLDIDPRPSVRATIMALKKAARTAAQAQEKVQNIISQAPYLRKTAMAVSVEFCGRFSLPMPDTAAATLDGMDTHIPPGEERKTLEEIRELSVTIGDTVEKGLGLQRGQSAPQRDEAR